MRLSSTSLGNLQHEELWHACAGPLVSLPAIGSRVVYFPQGHIEQVAAMADKVFEALPSYPSLPPQLVCQLHNVAMHAEEETDEVYAQMTLQTLSPEESEVYSNNAGAEAVGITRSKQPTNYFHKTLTASDTSTHGCCSIPRRAAEKVFPPLDFCQEPPAQELVAKDLHGNEWKFRHTFRGQPKRHLLTIGWTLFVNAKRLVAGDSVIFIWYGYNELLLGIRRANSNNRHQRLISGDHNNSMHVGLVAAHAAATNSPFTVSYFPRTNPSEFVIPFARYVKAVLHTRLFVGMRFRMLFETPESSVRRYMGKVVGIGDVEPVQWPNSQWRSVKVSWDEPTVGEKQFRVSPWEIEPLTTFPMYPSPFPNLPIKHPRPPPPPPAGLIPSHSHNGLRDDNDDDGISLTCSQVMMCFQNGANYNLGLQSNSNNLTLQQRFESLQSSDINPTLMASSSGVEEKRMTSATTTVNKLGFQPHQFQQQQTENNTSSSSSSRSATLLQSDQTNLLQSQQNFFEIVQVQENSFVEQQLQQQQAAAINAVLPPLLLSNYADFSPSSIIPPPTPPQPAPDQALYALPTLTNSSFPVDLGLLQAASSLECLPPPPLGVCVNPEVDSAAGREQFVAKTNDERFFF